MRRAVQPGLIILLGVFLSAPVRAQERSVLVLRGGVVIDGTSPALIPGATVIVSQGKIERVVTGSVPAPAGAQVVDLAGRYLLPGLIDGHVHISTLEQARRALLSGVTTARSAGASFFADVGLRELARLGHADAPEVLAAGYHVRPDPAEGLFLDDPSLGDLRESGLKGPEALRRAVRAMVKRGVNVIKVNATERAGTPQTDPRKPLYTEAELRAIVEEAGAAGIPVMAHAHGDEGARAAVAAGVRSIEHGTFLGDATLGLMAERGTFLAPTIAVVSDLTQPGGDYDNAALQIRGRFMLPRIRETAGRAVRAGVKVVAATDTGYGPESVVRLSHELEELVGIGMSPMQAIQAATVVAAEMMKVSDRTGRIAQGLDADLIVVERNPLEDIRAMQDILLVVNNGKVVLNRLTW
jgi:imidazolonepropionase-like amidohydrolase